MFSLFFEVISNFSDCNACSLQGKDEPLGRSVCTPLVKLHPGMDQTPKLLWYPIIQKGQKAGEALLAAELILKDKVSPGSNREATSLYNITLRPWWRPKSQRNPYCSSLCSRAKRIFPCFPPREQKASTWFLRASVPWCSSLPWRYGLASRDPPPAPPPSSRVLCRH